MLQIRPEQMKALAAASLENSITGHVRRFFATRCEELGTSELRRLIRGGLVRARAYGLSDEAEICRFVDLTMVFGPNFGADETTAWAHAILTDRESDHPPRRIDRLYAAAVERLAGGPAEPEETGGHAWFL